MVVGDTAGAGHEGLRVLGVDAALDGMALDHDVVLGHVERRAGGDADLLAHQVDAGHRLGDGMLDLQAGVHLDEVELAVLVEEFHGAGAAILELADGGGSQLADLAALFGVQRRRGGLFQHLLVAALQRTIALAQAHAGAHAVAQHLDLDMTRMVEVLLSR